MLGGCSRAARNKSCQLAKMVPTWEESWTPVALVKMDLQMFQTIRQRFQRRWWHCTIFVNEVDKKGGNDHQLIQRNGNKKDTVEATDRYWKSGRGTVENKRNEVPRKQNSFHKLSKSDIVSNILYTIWKVMLSQSFALCMNWIIKIWLSLLPRDNIFYEFSLSRQRKFFYFTAISFSNATLFPFYSIYMPLGQHEQHWILV